METHCLGCGAQIETTGMAFCGGCWPKIPSDTKTEIFKARAKLRKDGSEESRARLEKALRAAAEAARS